MPLPVTVQQTHKAPLIVGALIVMIPVIYFASCSVISSQRAEAFERVKTGDTEQQVIAMMGQPADRETNGGNRLFKYAAPACTAPCAQRLWYPNSVSLAGEEWSVEFGSDGKVNSKSHLTSP